ncbi:hypothetical protein KL941_001376 [Ogataea angusta]|nr:hypothetical protein KL941_001376 [Ogataea angusta]
MGRADFKSFGSNLDSTLHSRVKIDTHRSASVMSPGIFQAKQFILAMRTIAGSPNGRYFDAAHSVEGIYRTLKGSKPSSNGTPADRTEALLPILISLAVDIVSQLQSNFSGVSVLADLNSSSEAVLRAISCKASLVNQTRASICTKSTVPSPFSTPGGGCRTYRVSCKPMDAPQSNVHVKILQILDRFHPSCKIRLISALGQTYLPSDSNERKTESSQTCGLKVSSVMNRELPKGNT